MKAAIIGGGVIGGGWAARFALNSWDVAVFDPDPRCEEAIRTILVNARQAVGALSDVPPPAEGRITFAPSLAQAVAGADHVQESVGERLDLKRKVHAQILAANDRAVVGSSTSGFKASDLQAGSADPGRIVVAHPYNPVYLLPLVEIAPSAANTPDTVAKISETMRAIGMHPLHVRKEIDAFIGDRLLEAVWREALWLVRDGIATTEEIDETIRMGFGLRWAQMGLFETYRIAGGEAGMKHFMAQFGPALKWPWSRLTDVPDFDDALVDLIAGQSDAQSGHLSVRALERIRDDNLVGILRALKDRNWGAGRLLRAREEARAAPPEAGLHIEREVLPAWIDYNGHMTESRYYHLNSEVMNAFLALIGAGPDYVAGGHSFYSVETHIRHLGEAKLGERLCARIRILSADEKRFRSFVEIRRNDTLLATVEQLCLHVDAGLGKASPAHPEVWARLRAIAEQDAHLPMPEGAGRAVGQRP